jgi:c-di-GMP-binding flagellar brake protein YcgR
MSHWDDVHIKQRVELSIEVLKKQYNFGSTVVRKNDTAIFFPMPASQHSSAAIKKGQPTEVTIHIEDGVLIFNTEIDVIHPGQPPQVQINRPAEDQIHKRPSASTGIRVSVPSTYRVMRDPVTPISDTKKGETISLSSEDCTIHTVQQLKPGNYIELTLTLPKDETQVSLVGVIQDCMEQKSGAQVSYNSYIKFEVIRPGEQDKIVKFVFNQQRLMRKKGLY